MINIETIDGANKNENNDSNFKLRLISFSIIPFSIFYLCNKANSAY